MARLRELAAGRRAHRDAGQAGRRRRHGLRPRSCAPSSSAPARPWPWSRRGASSSRSTRTSAGAKDAQARDLRRQIEELRAQLARYAEALEEDLTSGREKVAARTREGLAFEKAFSDVSSLLLNHLKTRPEARDLLQELIAAMHGQSGPAGTKSESRTPGS